jgi:myo-inositol-1(or 4)-monophosphatase
MTIAPEGIFVREIPRENRYRLLWRRSMEIMHEMEIADHAAREAGRIIIGLMGKAGVSEKGLNYNLVTDADTASEKSIVSAIKKAFPDDAIIGEEGSSNAALDAERVWIVDPLDGTTNFAHGIPHFSVSIAFAERGSVRCGIVLNPVYDECFSATAGQGAFRNGVPIRVSAVATLGGAVIGTGFYYERGPIMLRTLDSVRKLLQANIQGIRRIGSAALDICYVACGRYDGYFEYRLSPWDFAAGYLILKEAGGLCTDVDGVERGLLVKGVFASNGHIHDAMFELAGWPPEVWDDA